MEIFKLFGSILIDNDKANQSLSDTDKKAGGVGATLGKMGGFALKAGAAVGAMAVAGGTAMLGLVSKTIDVTAEINKFAQVTGHSTTAFQEWDYVMKTAGYSMEQASGDIAALAEKAMDAAAGAGDGAEFFSKLGLSVTDTSGKLKTQEQLFQETILALQGMEDVTERNAIASALLSTTGEELVPILNMTAEELANVKSQANIITDEQLKQTDDLKKKWDAAKTTFLGVATSIGISLMPIFDSMLNWVMSNMPTIKEVFSTVFGIINTLVTKSYEIFNNNILPILKVLFAWINENMPTFKAIFNEVFTAVSDIATRLWCIFNDNLLPIFKDLYDFVKPTFPVIGAIIKTAFDVVIKVVDGVISVFETLTGWIKTAIDWIQKFNGTSVKDKNVSVSTTSFRRVPPGLAEGGTTLTSGRVLVGENAPEILDLPAGARVTPLNKLPSGGITININGANIMDDYGVDRMMDRVMDRLALQGVR